MASSSIEKLTPIVVIAILSFIITIIAFKYLESTGFFSKGDNILTGGAAGFVIIFGVIIGAYRILGQKQDTDTATQIAELISEKIIRESGENKGVVKTKYYVYLESLKESFKSQGRSWNKELEKQLKAKTLRAFLDKYNVSIDLTTLPEDIRPFEDIRPHENMEMIN